MNKKGISIVALIITIITMIILSAIVVNGVEERTNEFKPDVKAIISCGNMTIQVDVERYQWGYGTATIYSKDGKKYATSDFIIVEEYKDE